MSFIASKQGGTYAPGWFLADAENVERVTQQISASHANAKTDTDGGKHVPMGSVWPSNDTHAKGILYEDVDVSTGDMPGSVVISGVVYKDRLAVSLDNQAKTSLEKLGFKFLDTAPAVTRPY